MKDVADALANLEKAAGDNFWMIAKGRTRPQEPLFAAAIYPGVVMTKQTEPIAIAEGHDLPTVINDCARKASQPDEPMPWQM